MKRRMLLDAKTAARLTRLTLGQIGREYPQKLDQVLTGPEDLQSPAALHPAFHGSFDWHSCVAGWWQLLTIVRLFPDLPDAAQVRARADTVLTPEAIAGELAWLERPGAATFERPYGWAWALALHGEAARHDEPWAAALEPLARALATRLRLFLPQLGQPARSGAHDNTAFALVLAGDWAAMHDPRLAAQVRARASDWFGGDRDCQAWEPGGEDFLSPALCEALLMSRVLSGPAFRTWFTAFLPGLARGEPATLFTPVTVSDRRDGRLAHGDGLNLSRAWCWRILARELGSGHAMYEAFQRTATDHLQASLPHLADDDAGAHWLPSFALLALMA